MMLRAGTLTSWHPSCYVRHGEVLIVARGGAESLLEVARGVSQKLQPGKHIASADGSPALQKAASLTGSPSLTGVAHLRFNLHSVGDTCQTGSAPRICESPPKAGARWNGEREEGEFHSMCWWSGRRRPCIRVQRTVASHGSLEHQCSRQNWASQCIVCSLPQQGARLGQNSESAILA